MVITASLIPSASASHDNGPPSRVCLGERAPHAVIDVDGVERGEEAPQRPRACEEGARRAGGLVSQGRTARQFQDELLLPSTPPGGGYSRPMVLAWRRRPAAASSADLHSWQLEWVPRVREPAYPSHLDGARVMSQVCPPPPVDKPAFSICPSRSAEPLAGARRQGPRWKQVAQAGPGAPVDRGAGLPMQ